MNEQKKKKRFRFPIRVKTTLGVFIATIILVEVAMIFFSTVSSSSNQQTYKNTADHLSATISQVADGAKVAELKNEVKAIVDASEDKPLSDEMGTERWNAYIAQFDHIQQEPLFIELRDVLRGIVNVNGLEVDCAYFCYIDNVNRSFVYIVDSAPEEDACPPGTLDPLYEVNYGVLKDPSIGFPAYITNTPEYGWLVTAGAPVYHNGEVVAYATVDISMQAIRSRQKDNIIRLFVYMVASGLVTAIIILVLIHFGAVAPLKKLTDVANSYDIMDAQKTHETFQKLSVTTHDEFYDLAESMKKMESDVHEKIQALVHMNQELANSQQETRKMAELASKDGLTGVRNKVAFDTEASQINEAILEGDLIQFGIAMIDLNDLKVINDRYGHGNGDVALIKLSDIICTTFMHSPVFRVGGDEFVVILRGADFRNAAKLINEFNQEIEAIAKDDELLPAEKTSAAIGFASFDPAVDHSVEDVLKRADELMYKKKRAMKQAGTPAAE